MRTCVGLMHTRTRIQALNISTARYSLAIQTPAVPHRMIRWNPRGTAMCCTALCSAEYHSGDLLSPGTLGKLKHGEGVLTLPHGAQYRRGRTRSAS